MASRDSADATRIAVPVILVVGFGDGKVSHEHIQWDQATVLVEAGQLDSSGLPAVSSEQAEALLNQDRPNNELFDNDA